MKTLNFFGIVAGFCTLVSLFDTYFFAADLLTTFKQQYFLYLLPLAIINFIQKRKKLAYAFFIGCIINGYFIFPTYISIEKIQDKQITIFYANINSSNKDHKKLLDLITNEKPDIIGLIEVNDDWKKSLQALKANYPYVHIHPEGGNFGLALISKYEIKDLEVIESKQWLKSLFGKFTVGNKEISLFLTHPLPPIDPEHWKFRNQHIDEISKFLAEKKIKSLFIFGDFNSVSWSPSIVRFKEKLNLKFAKSFNDTWNTAYPPLLRVSIDHGLVTKDIAINKEILASIGSDHFPISYALSF